MHQWITNWLLVFSSSVSVALQEIKCLFLFLNTILKELLDSDQENAMDSTPAGSLYFVCPCRFPWISLEGFLFLFDHYIQLIFSYKESYTLMFVRCVETDKNVKFWFGFFIKATGHVSCLQPHCMPTLLCVVLWYCIVCPYPFPVLLHWPWGVHVYRLTFLFSRFLHCIMDLSKLAHWHSSYPPFHLSLAEELREGLNSWNAKAVVGLAHILMQFPGRRVKGRTGQVKHKSNGRLSTNVNAIFSWGHCRNPFQPEAKCPFLCSTFGVGSPDLQSFVE